ncbi:MAG: 3-dehydroquinate synthase [Chloroflexi bacterium]|nr:MAG: 3-dehydroquinate synthase [Chloroflexota bacterium]
MVLPVFHLVRRWTESKSSRLGRICDELSGFVVIMRGMNLPNIVLTGFMGTGKTTVGRLLAERLGLKFVDTDLLIEARDGRSVSNIFREAGEEVFRRLEAAVAQELAEEHGLVIATGGRLMLDSQNALALQKNGRVVCLVAEPEEIVRRLAGDTQRPLLNVSDPKKQVNQLLQARAARYGRFPQITTSGKSPETVADEIIRYLGESNLIRLPVTHPQGSYDVLVGEWLLPRLAELAGGGKPMAVVTDENVGAEYGRFCPPNTPLITIPAGEQHKNLETVRTIYNALIEAGIDRNSTIVALGGGVVGDIAGFVAATYLRGVRFVQCPTTLLAMVDASVGGKTGVDLPQGKNLVGAFKQPAIVIADLTTLVTLPLAEFRAGLAEVVKHGLIAAPSLFFRLENIDLPENLPLIPDLQSLVVRAITVKRNVVQADPFETGRRAVLNLGHTFAHAIEQVSGYTIRHGEAVAMGLVAAAALSAKLGFCSATLPGRIMAVLARLGLPVRIPADLSPKALLAAMNTDKKRVRGQMRFVLVRDVGDVFVTGDVPETAVLQVLHQQQIARDEN